MRTSSLPIMLSEAHDLRAVVSKLEATLLLVSGVCGVLFPMGCSGGDRGGPLVPSDDPRQNVMVIDEGIDVSAAEFNGKVVAVFTRECPSESVADGGLDGDASGEDGGGAEDSGTSDSFGNRKREYIAALMTPGPSCHLRAGIDSKSDPLASVSRYRARWNAMLRGQRYGDTTFFQAEWDEIWAALEAEFRIFNFHGTATAGTVAHDNPGVRLVLVDRPLGNVQTFQDSFVCLNQPDIDEAVALLNDPEVRDAYVHAPTSPYVEEFRSIVAQYNVGVINESFGGEPRAVLEQTQLDRGCIAVTFLAYFSALGDLDRARSQLVGAPPYVWTQAAGNSAAAIDAPADSADCTPGDERHLLVGSTDLAQLRSSFSNFGECVDVYAPGEDIIAPYAGGWLLPVQGTSFAAPLVARMISLAPISPYDPGEARRRLLDRVDLVRTLPIAAFPRDFFYAPNLSGTKLGALSISISKKLSALSRRPPRLGKVDWSNRGLWPLLRLIVPNWRQIWRRN